MQASSCQPLTAVSSMCLQTAERKQTKVSITKRSQRQLETVQLRSFSDFCLKQKIILPVENVVKSLLLKLGGWLERVKVKCTVMTPDPVCFELSSLALAVEKHPGL